MTKYRLFQRVGSYWLYVWNLVTYYTLVCQIKDCIIRVSALYVNMIQNLKYIKYAGTAGYSGWELSVVIGANV